jgi:hypothetical protein
METKLLVFLIILSVLAGVISLSSPDVFKEEVAVSYLHLQNVEYSLSKVNDSHVVLNFTLTFERSKILKNTTITTKIFDSRTGLLLQRFSVSAEKMYGNEMVIPIKLRKDKNYRIQFEGGLNDKTTFKREYRVTGLTNIIPDSRILLLELKDADFMIGGEIGNKARIKMRFYIYSMENYSNIIFHIKAVQLESNILANESWIEMENVEEGRTILLETEMDVPKDYNYFVKIEAWRDGMLLKKWEYPLKLSPTEIIPEKMKKEETKINISEFVKEYEEYPKLAPTPIRKYTPQPTPGFEVTLVLVSIAFAHLIRRGGFNGGKYRKYEKFERR